MVFSEFYDFDKVCELLNRPDIKSQIKDVDHWGFRQDPVHFAAAKGKKNIKLMIFLYRIFQFSKLTERIDMSMNKTPKINPIIQP